MIKLKNDNYRTKKGRELLAAEISGYFAMCDRENLLEERDKKTKRPYTLTGLLCWLDMSEGELAELEALSRYHRRIIGGAKRKIEAYIEENSLAGRLSATASINSLKEHFGWQTKGEGDGDEAYSLELSDDIKRLGE